MPDYYLTIEEKTEGIFKDKGSKFLSFAYPVRSEEEIKEILDGVRKKYHNARHHCYAWVLGAYGQFSRANDDGEPSSTAGKPILTQIQSEGLTNVLVIVVRYFGGILLGTGGLIHAYRSSARDALDKVHVKKEYFRSLYEIKFPYSEMNSVMKILKEVDGEYLEQSFGMECYLKASILKKLKSVFEQGLANHSEIRLNLLSEE